MLAQLKLLMFAW